MKKFHIYGTVVGGKYIGEYEVETEEQAIEIAWKDARVSLCHACSPECEDPEITELHADEIKDEEK